MLTLQFAGSHTGLIVAFRGETDFNFDYHVSFTAEEMAKKKAFYNFKIQDPKAPEREGHSVFYKDASGAVFHCYSCYDRGNDLVNIHCHYLDLAPKGRMRAGAGRFGCGGTTNTGSSGRKGKVNIRGVVVE